MDKDLLQPAATIVAGVISAQGPDGDPIDIKDAFMRVYRELEAAKKELTPRRTAKTVPFRI